MVKNTRTKYTDTINEGSFMGLEAVVLDYFKITLVEHVRVGKKGELEVSRDNNFNLKIKSNISQAYKEKLENELKVAFKLNWAPYNYQNKEYEYYTSKYMAESEKIERLTNIFEVLKNFEIYYKEAIQESLEVFKKDSIDKRSYADYEVVVKFNEEKNCFVVLGLKFLGEKFFILSNASLKKGKISESNYKDSGFFDEYLDVNAAKYQKYGLNYFEINPESYGEIRNIIEVKEKTKEIFIEKQEKILETLGQSNLAHFDEENIFNLKIIYDEKLKMFEFYCKGYFEPQYYEGQVSERSLLSYLAVNYLFSKILTPEEIEDNFNLIKDNTKRKNNFLNDRDLEYFVGNKNENENAYKYNLIFEEESAKREKKLYLSLEYNEVLKEIIANYEKNRSFFARKVKNIKIKNQNVVRANEYLNKKYPTIYLHDDGRCFFVLGTRETMEVLAGTPLKVKSKLNSSEVKNDIIPENVETKISKGRSGSFTMKAFEISYEEAVSYLYEHKWKEMIEQNSMYLNTELWMTNDNKPQLNDEDRRKSFNMILLNSKLQSDSKKEVKLKTKKLKI